MDLRQMKYFLAVAEEGQITKAAERLHICQPPLSQQIKQLEDSLGLRLLERKGRHVELTEAGNILRVRAEQILALVSSVTKELSDLNQGQHGTLSIGTVASSGAFVLPKWIGTFHARYPEVTFQMWEDDTYRILELVNKGVAEVGIIRTPFNTEKYEFIMQPSNTDPMVAVCNANWKLDTATGSAPLKLLADKPLIIHRRNEQKITAACENYGFKPQILCCSDDIRSILSWAHFGLGIAVVPKASVNLIECEGMTYKEIQEETLATRTAVIWLKNHYLSAVARNFVKIVTE